MKKLLSFFTILSFLFSVGATAEIQQNPSSEFIYSLKDVIGVDFNKSDIDSKITALIKEKTDSKQNQIEIKISLKNKATRFLQLHPNNDQFNLVTMDGKESVFNLSLLDENKQAVENINPDEQISAIILSKKGDSANSLISLFKNNKIKKLACIINGATTLVLLFEK